MTRNGIQAEDVSLTYKGAGFVVWRTVNAEDEKRALDTISTLIQKEWVIASHTTVHDQASLIHTVIMVRYP